MINLRTLKSTKKPLTEKAPSRTNDCESLPLFPNLKKVQRNFTDFCEKLFLIYNGSKLENSESLTESKKKTTEKSGELLRRQLLIPFPPVYDPQRGTKISAYQLVIPFPATSIQRTDSVAYSS